jgi:hypothetical protein
MIKMDEIRAALDKLVARMRAPGAQERMQKAFSMTPAELGKAAVEVAKRRKNGQT